MDILPLINTVIASLALLTALAALALNLRLRGAKALRTGDDSQQKHDAYTEIANTLSEGAMLWQRLMIQCDELSSSLISSRLNESTSEIAGDWLATLREFSKNSKTEIDHAYQTFAQAGKRMSAEELILQIPDMSRFEKEMKGNMTVIADQIDHIDRVIHGEESLSGRQLKITLQKPQAMPHFLRKKQKIAELQRRRTQSAAAA